MEGKWFFDTDNYRKRVLKRLAEILDLPNLTFQIIRRTMATLSQTKGGPKATQGMMRHSRMPTSTDIYQQVIPEEVEKMVNFVHSDLRKPSSAAGKMSENAAKFRAKRKRSSI